MIGKRTLLAGVAALALAAYGLYAAAALRSPLFDARERDRIALFGALARAKAPPTEDQRTAAEAYWRRYPDVAEDGFFGRQGPMGIRGAFEHYRRHGRPEGRVWESSSRK